MARKKTRAHSRWKADSDYRVRLDDEARRWLDRFENEHYRAEFTTPATTKKERARRQEIYNAESAARRDAFTAPLELIASACFRVVAPNHRHEHYEPSDYAMMSSPATSAELEDAYLEVIEAGFPTELELKACALVVRRTS